MSNRHKANCTVKSEDSMNSESDNESTMNSEIDDEDPVNLESDNADLTEDTNDDEDSKSDNIDSEDEEEEVELESCETESRAVNREKKRKKVTDELTEAVPKKKKKFENNLYKQPTVEELSQLRETENLFHSNLFRLQIEEVLNEVRLQDKYKALFEIWFGKLKAAIESIEETEEVPVSNMIYND